MSLFKGGYAIGYHLSLQRKPPLKRDMVML
ncbi:hypothetical protein AVEN_12517-1, partial [Araneus ventricosus]